MENPIKMEDLGVPLFLETPILGGFRCALLKAFLDSPLFLWGWRDTLIVNEHAAASQNKIDMLTIREGFLNFETSTTTTAYQKFSEKLNIVLMLGFS